MEGDGVDRQTQRQAQRGVDFTYRDKGDNVFIAYSGGNRYYVK